MTDEQKPWPVATGPDGFSLWDRICSVCKQRKLCQYRNRYICPACYHAEQDKPKG